MVGNEVTKGFRTMRRSLIALSLITTLFGGAAYASLGSWSALASCRVSDWVNISRSGRLTSRVVGPGYNYPRGTRVSVTAVRCAQGQTYYDGTVATNYQEYRVNIQGKGPYVLTTSTVQLD